MRDRRQGLERKRVRASANTTREGIIERIVGDYDVPPELLCGGCFAEIRGRHQITVRGCRRVVRYSPEAVVLKMKRDTVVIAGKRLRCLTYFSGAVTVEGIIDSFSFSRDCEGGDK
jgi:sporulation protein YqfC